MHGVNDDPQYAPTGKWDGGGSSANPEPNRSALSDRELLFGRLAVHNGFVDKDTLNKAQEQPTDPSKSLDEILVNSGAITEETRRAIESLVEQHIAKHDNDPQKSLSSFSPTVSYAAADSSDIGSSGNTICSVTTPASASRSAAAWIVALFILSIFFLTRFRNSLL